MALGPESRESLLERARTLWGGRDFATLSRTLEPLDRSDLLAEPSLGFYLADAWHRLGERERALELARQLAPACARRGNDRLSRERLNLEGVLLFGMGDLPGAEEAWTRLLEVSMRAGDEALVARAGHNFGVIYTLRGEWERALVSYQRAQAAYQRLGYLRGLAQVHNNLGMTFREIDFFADADRHFLQAIEYAQVTGSDDEAGRARVERALLLCYEGDLALAGVTAELALEGWRRMGDTLHTGDAHRVLAIIGLAEARWSDASMQAEQALALALSSRAALVEAEVRDLLAVLALQRGDPDRAASLHAEADQQFTAMGALPWGRSLRSRLERLAGRP